MSSDTEIDPSGSACPKKLSAAFGRIAATRPRNYGGDMMHESQSSRQATPGGQSPPAAGADSGAAATVTISGGVVRGAVVLGGYVFRGLPYAAPPTGDLRWRLPRPPADWQGVRDATRFAPSCPQPQNPALTGPTSEDCLYLSVYTSTLDSRDGAGLPVLVWIHGGLGGAA
jgi:carboxylesterase family protein